MIREEWQQIPTTCTFRWDFKRPVCNQFQNTLIKSANVSFVITLKYRKISLKGKFADIKKWFAESHNKFVHEKEISGHSILWDVIT